jgi:hypothetical protein
MPGIRAYSSVEAEFLLTRSQICKKGDDVRANGKQGVRAKRYLTMSGLAELVGIDIKTVPVWWKAGKLPPPIEGFGLKPRWSREAVIAWANERGVPLSDPTE